MKTMQSKTERNANKGTAAALLVFFLIAQIFETGAPVYAELAPVGPSALPVPAAVTTPNATNTINNMVAARPENSNDFLMGITLSAATVPTQSSGPQPVAGQTRPGMPTLSKPSPQLTDRSPTLQWTTPTGTVDHYDIIVKKRVTAADGSVSLVNVEPRNRAAGNSNSLTLPPLEPGTYSFAIRACASATDETTCSGAMANPNATPPVTYHTSIISGGIAPTPPTGIQPHASGIVYNHMPEITWTESPEAASYHIIIESVVTGGLYGTAFKIDDMSVYTNRYIPTTALPTGLYRIRLFAKNEVGPEVRALDANSNVFFQVRDAAIAELPRVTSVSTTTLSSQAAVLDHTPTITFGSLAQASAYDLQIVDSAGNIKVSKNNLTQVSYTLAFDEQLFGGNYTVQIRAKNNLTTGTPAWGPAFRFNVLDTKPAAPTTPQPRGQTTQMRPIFTWKRVEGEQNYHLTLTKKDAAGIFRAFPGNDVAMLSGNSYQFQNALEPGIYRVVVTSSNTAGESEPSPYAVLTISETTPTVPVVTGPSGVVSGYDTTLTWNPVDGARSYDVEVTPAGGRPFTRTVNMAPAPQGTSLALRVPTDLPTEGSYSFRVRARNNTGESAYTPAASFEIQVPMPATPVVASLGTERLTDHTPTFTWSAVANASEYHLQVLRADNTVVLEDLHVRTNSWTPAVDLAGGAYRVMVQAFNGFKSGSFSTPMSFLINTPPAAIAQNLSGREGVRKTMILGAAADADGETMTYTYSAPASLLRNGSFTQIGNQLTYIPNAGYLVSNAMIQVTANDGHETVSATVTLSIDAAVVNRPNDPLIGSQANQAYWLDSVNTFRAWNLSRGMGVTVAVIDSGVDLTHPDLIGQIFTNTADNTNNGVNEDGNFQCLDYDTPANCDVANVSNDLRGIDFTDDVHGWDFGDNDNDANLATGSSHGTRVAGIIAAEADNNEGASGIAPKSKILPVRVFSAIRAIDDVEIVRSILYAARMGAKVINMSLGRPLSALTLEWKNRLQAAIDYAVSLGSIIVASSGNNFSSTEEAPGALDKVITVGALTRNNLRADFSTYGSTLDFMAPGVGIVSSVLSSTSDHLLTTGYGRDEGTSFAAPIVSGIIGLMAAQMKAWLTPTGTAPQVLTHADAMRRLQYSSLDLGDLGRDDYYGYGKVDAFKALSYDYYDDGTVKTQWLENADERQNTRLDFDRQGRMIGGNVTGVFR